MTQEGITVRWDMGLNKKRIAYFHFAQPDSASLPRGRSETRTCRIRKVPPY